MPCIYLDFGGASWLAKFVFCSVYFEIGKHDAVRKCRILKENVRKRDEEEREMRRKTREE